MKGTHQRLRWLGELVLLSLLFAWLPLVYQLLAGAAASLLIELTRARLAARNLRLQLADGSVAEIVRQAALFERKDSDAHS